MNRDAVAHFAHEGEVGTSQNTVWRETVGDNQICAALNENSKPQRVSTSCLERQNLTLVGARAPAQAVG
jgi:hypothetical protein